MKYSIVALSAIVAAVQAQANVAFTNSNYDVKPGVPFVLTYPADQCAAGCTISLKSGPSDNLQTVKVLNGASKSGKEEVTLDTSVPAGKLAFEIKRNDGGKPNYSPQFDFVGTGAAVTGSSAATSAATASSASQSSPVSTSASSTMSMSSSESSASSTTSAPTSMISSISNTTSLTSSARNMTTTSSSTDTDSSTTTRSTGSVSTATTIPGAADRASASWVVMAAGFAAMVYFN